MDSDFEAKAAAFHRSYQRRNGIAGAVVGVILLGAGLVGTALCVHELMKPEERMGGDPGDLVRLASYTVIALIAGLGALWKSSKLLRGRDD